MSGRCARFVGHAVVLGIVASGLAAALAPLAPAEAAPTVIPPTDWCGIGTGEDSYVPVSNASLFYNSAVAAGTWNSKSIAGLQYGYGVPASGVDAVMLRVFADATTSGYSFFTPTTTTSTGAQFAYDGLDDSAPFTVIVKPHTDGKIRWWFSSAATVKIDVIGYFNANTAGGFRPVDHKVVLSTATGIGVPVGQRSSATVDSDNRRLRSARLWRRHRARERHGDGSGWNADLRWPDIGEPQGDRVDDRRHGHHHSGCRDV